MISARDERELSPRFIPERMSECITCETLLPNVMEPYYAIIIYTISFTYVYFSLIGLPTETDSVLHASTYAVSISFTLSTITCKQASTEVYTKNKVLSPFLSLAAL